MRIRPIGLTVALAALLLAPDAVSAQQRGATIRAGMTRAEVRAAFGAPARTRTAGGWTYLFYANGCAPRCGSDDVVFLRDGRVVAAVLRTSARRFDGPSAARALETLRPRPSSAETGPRLLGVPAAGQPDGRVRPPARAKDVEGAVPADRPERLPPADSLPPGVEAAPDSVRP